VLTNSGRKLENRASFWTNGRLKAQCEMFES
jgi:hypothetical protein